MKDMKGDYKIGDYAFKNFIHLTEAEIRSVYEWRNHKDIRKWMYDSEEILYANHLDFMRGLAAASGAAYWMVCYKNEPIGAVYLVDINVTTNCAEIGFYHRPDKKNQCLFGLDFVYHLYFFVFNVLECQTLHGSILCENRDSLFLSLYMGAELKGKKIVEMKEYYIVETSRLKFNTEVEHKSNVKEYLLFVRQQLKN